MSSTARGKRASAERDPSRTSPSAETRRNRDDGPAAIRARIALLPERQRLAVFLRYYADLEYRDIAEVLGIAVGTVSATLAAAHATLRISLQEADR